MWGNINSYDRNIRIFVAGTILYVVAYLLLQSKYTNNIPQLQNYKKYIYHVFASDLSTVLIQMKFGQDKKDKKNKKKSKKNIKKNMKKNKPSPQIPGLTFGKLVPLNKNMGKFIPNQDPKPQNDDNSVSLPIYNGNVQKTQDSIESDIPIPVYRPMRRPTPGEGNGSVEVAIADN